MFLPLVFAAAADEGVLGNLLVQPASTVSVHLESNGEESTLSVVEATHSIATSYGSAFGVTSRTLCLAPCDVEMPAGLYTFMVGGKGKVGVSKLIELKPGVDVSIDAKLGSAGLKYGGFMLLTVVGVPALLTGPMFVFLADELGDPGFGSTGWILTGVGVAGTAGGIAMLVGSNSKLEVNKTAAGGGGGTIDGGADSGVEIVPYFAGNAFGVVGTF